MRWDYAKRGEKSDKELSKPGEKQKSTYVFNPHFASIGDAVRAQVNIGFSKKGWSGVQGILQRTDSKASELGARLGAIGYGAHDAKDLASVHDKVVRTLQNVAEQLGSRLNEMPANSPERKQLQHATSWLNQQIEIAKTRTR